MIKKSVAKEIDRVIKDIWNKNIPKDFKSGYIINEDCLKMSLCYHLRRRLASLLNDNNLRIYTEKYFSGIKKKPDIIIAQMRDEYSENTLRGYLNWFDGRRTRNWAAGKVTELDAGWIDGKMQYEIQSY